MKSSIAAVTDSGVTVELNKGATTDHLFIAKQALGAQAEAISRLAQRLGNQFNQTIDLILHCSGRVVVCGMGKSGLVGKKMVATLASTGTPSFFMHPGEAFHGDLGMLLPQDLVILISYSGVTEEVIKLIPSLKSFGNKIVAMTGKGDSTLARHADLCLDISVEREVCPNNLAPTTSTLATMALGDAIAVALINARDFKPADFARYHPGGSLGRKLLTRVQDVMRRTNLPICSPDENFRSVIHTMTKGRLGLAVIMDGGRLAGLITDGDLRRAMENVDSPGSLKASDFMTKSPITVNANAMLADAEDLMRTSKVSALIVTNSTQQVAGVLHFYND